MTKQIEFGQGDVWSLEAASPITSGLVVWMSGNAKVGVAQASGDEPIGVSLIPASRGDQCAFITRGVVEIYTTGTGNTTAGTRMVAASAGKCAAGPGDVPRYDFGIAYETITRNAKGKIFLTI